MDFLLKNKIYLLPFVVVALMFGYFFYNSSVMDLWMDDFGLIYSAYYGHLFKMYRPYTMAMIVGTFDFKGNEVDRYFYSAIFMSIIFVVFLYIISFYVNFRFLWNKKDKIGQDTLIYVIVFILFMATNNSLGNIFWFSSFVCHIVGELLCLLFFIHYLPFLEKDNFEKIANRSFLTKFLWIAYLCVLACLLGSGTETTSLFAIFSLILLMTFLIKKYGKKYFTVYLFYFIPALLIISLCLLNQANFRMQYDRHSSDYIIEKINSLVYFYKYWINYMYNGYKYFIPLIIMYLVILGLYLFKKININNKKIFNRSSLMFFAFFINMNILIYSLFSPALISNILTNNPEKRWFTMSDVFLALFVIHFFWFLMKEFKEKLPKIFYKISVLILSLLIIVSFVQKVNQTNQFKKYWEKSFKERGLLIAKIKNEIAKNDCFVLDNIMANKIIVPLTRNRDLNTVMSFFDKNYYDVWIKQNKLSIYDSSLVWFFGVLTRNLALQKIDTSKIKFGEHDVCETKKVDNKGENTIKKNSK
jgi:hypothetical protein